jgi:hemolysin activation/secretion protein
LIGLVIAPSVAAQGLPGPADVGRIQPEEKIIVPEPGDESQVAIPQENIPLVPAPEAAKAIHFVLRNVTIEGGTALSTADMADLYTPYLGQEVTLDIAWSIAAGITNRYRNAGYFLSRAYVPQQQVRDGVITIGVIEGYIGKVEVPAGTDTPSVVQDYIDQLVKQRPVTAAEVESFLLRLNDLPGLSFRAVLSPLEEKQPAAPAVKLSLIATDKAGTGSMSFDNYSSRFLGPHEFSGSYSTSLLPLQQTTISGLNSAPFDRLHYGFLGQTIVLAPSLSFDVNGSVTTAKPAYTLSPFHIDSEATYESASLNYQWLRQRTQNLMFKATFDVRDVSSDILGAPLTRDHIRTFRAGATYDFEDAWNGTNIINFTASHGIDGLGASHPNASFLSRAGADPDFSKGELSVSRLQRLTENWSLFAAAYGQVASGVLFSSEQFGYGGQSFGRSFDASELTGDSGIDEALELRYNGFTSLQPINVQPYTFCDSGTVWNSALGQPNHQTGASAGFGVRLSSVSNQFANLGAAWPLDRVLANPIYGDNRNGPRILLQLGQQF